jgi:hypothetical protein
MESNGKAGMIHVSQATAERLLASGKGKWLTKREDTIVAKGIGEMTTYWVKVSSESMISSSGRDGDSHSPPEEETTRSCSSTINHPRSGSPIENSNRKQSNKVSPPKSTIQHILSM